MDPNDTFLRLWTTAQPTLAAYVGSLVRDRHATDDIVQEVAVVAWRKFTEFDATRAFLPWVLGIARCEVLGRRRTFARSFLTYQSDLVETIAEAYESQADELAERTDALRGCLEGLPERTQDYVRLRYQEDLSPGDIAERLGRDVNVVRVALHRLRSSLEECIRRRLTQQGTTS